MQNELKKILNGMNVRDDRIRTEEGAIELCKKGVDALEYLIETGLNLKAKTLDHKTKTKLKSIIFTISVFYKSKKSVLLKFSRYPELINLLTDLYFLGFESAHNLLSDMDFTNFEIYRKKLHDLPQAEKHRNDKEISTREAFEEIRMSRNYHGSKGFKKDRYALGYDDKRIYEIYRIDKNLFSLRTYRRE